MGICTVVWGAIDSQMAKKKRRPNRYFKDLITAIGMGFLWGSTLFMTYVFIKAYSSPYKKVAVYINELGEANLELGMILVCLPMAYLSSRWMIQKWKNTT